MKEPSYKSMVRTRLREARANNVKPPVIACLWYESRHARAIYLDRHGRKLRPPKPPDPFYFTVELWTVTEAVELLRRHAGIGGLAVARHIAEHLEDFGWILLDVQQPSLSITTFTTGQPLNNLVYYDDLVDLVCHRCTKAARGRGAMHCHLQDGHTVVVCGATTRKMIKTIGLVGLADSGCLPSLTTKVADTLRLADEDLATILRRLFVKNPRIVAEAIMALRKAPGHRDAWLMSVLNSDPSLRDLVEAVRQEIAPAMD